MANENDDPELMKIRKKKLEDLTKDQSPNNSISEPVPITDQEFPGFINEHSLVIIDCWAGWCAPCKMLSPIIDQLAKEYAGKVTFGKLNVDENPSTAQKYSIMSIPTLLVFQNGSLVDNIVGAHPYEALKPKIGERILSETVYI